MRLMSLLDTPDRAAAFRVAILAAPSVATYAAIPMQARGLYALVRNGTDEIVYVGQTNGTIRRRWHQHKHLPLLTDGSHRLHWVAEDAGCWETEYNVLLALRPRLNRPARRRV